MSFTYTITTNGNLSNVGDVVTGVTAGNGLITITSSDGFVKNFNITVNDVTAPNAPTNLAIDNTGLILTGKAEIASTVKSYTSADVLLKTTTADSNGDFTITFDSAFLNGETIKVNATDTNGNVSSFATVNAPDTTVPNAPTNIFFGTGLTVTGKAEPNSTIKVKNTSNVVLKTGTTDANGDFSVTLDTAFSNGEGIRITATDASGNESSYASANAPDTTAPDAPTATFDGTGGIVSGTSEKNTTIKIKSDTDVLINDGVADASGDYSITLDTPLTNGETVHVTATDSNNNESGNTVITAPTIP